MKVSVIFLIKLQCNTFRNYTFFLHGLIRLAFYTDVIIIKGWPFPVRTYARIKNKNMCTFLQLT